MGAGTLWQFPHLKLFRMEAAAAELLDATHSIIGWRCSLRLGGLLGGSERYVGPPALWFPHASPKRVAATSTAIIGSSFAMRHMALILVGVVHGT
jgi:hypothetical protein